jgi:hypothetical protein
MVRQKNMNSNFIQRDGGRLYGTTKTGQQEYGVEFFLNGSKLSVANPKWTFLASMAKSASNLSSTFRASLSEGCPMTLSFSCMPSLCHLLCDFRRHLLAVLGHNFDKPCVMSPPFKRMVSTNQDHYGVPTPKHWCIIHHIQELDK